MNADINAICRAMENAGIYWFDYNAENKTARIPAKMQTDFGLEAEYRGMPFSLADALADEGEAAAFFRIFSADGRSKTFFTAKNGRSFYASMSGGRNCEYVCIMEPAQTKPDKKEAVSIDFSSRMMMKLFYRIACIDLKQNSMKTIKIDDSEKLEEQDFYNDYDSSIRRFARDYVTDEYRQKFLNVMLPERLEELFSSKLGYVTIKYRRYERDTIKWVRTEVISLPDDFEGGRKVMWYARNISEDEALEENASDKLLSMNKEMHLRLETISGASAVGFKVSKDDGDFTYKFLDKNAAALFGYTKEEFLSVTGGAAKGAVYPEDLPGVLEELSRQLDRGDTYSVKYRVKCRDGSTKWIIDSGQRIVNESGERLFYSSYCDITETEIKNIELNNAFLMLNQVVRILSNGIFVYSIPEHKIIIMNDEAKRVFDYNSKIDDNDGAIDEINRRLVKEDIQAIRPITEKIKKPGDSAEYRFRIVHRDGTTLTVQAKSKMLEFADGSRFIISNLNDISGFTRLMNVIQEERRQYRDAMVSDCEFAYTCDLTDGVVYESDIAPQGANVFEVLGVKGQIKHNDLVQKWIAKRNPEFITSKSRTALTSEDMIHQFENGVHSAELEYYDALTCKYTRITALMNQSTYTNHITAFIMGKDITEERRREEITKQALRDAYEAAKRANEAKTDFLSRMSHDMRTPMNAIIGMTAIAATHINDRERVSSCLDKITTSSSHLLSLINEVLDMSKIESGKVDLEETEFNISDLIDNLLAMVCPQAHAKKQTVNVQIRGVEHDAVIADELRLQQSFVNLMTNAVKYTPDGGRIDLIIDEKPSAQTKTGYFEFVFRDNGIGMDKETIAHIFEPFYRASDSSMNKLQGTGLGLAITKNLVHMMNGDIRIESEPGKGSEFTVSICLKLQNTETADIASLKSKSALVAAGDEETCKNVCGILGELGMNSECVMSGEEAVELVQQRHSGGADYFAVILDWKMPGIGGVEAAERIRRIVGKDIVIIIMSAYDWSDAESEAKEAGVDALMSKPLFKTRLSSVLSGFAVSGGRESSADGREAVLTTNFGGERILLAEDNDLNAEIMIEILSMMNIKTERALNGQDAADMFEASEEGYYKLIFMDIQMPVMNGNDAARAIRSMQRGDAATVPIIAMTANAFTDDIQAALDAGMDAHIAKPVDFNKLVKELKKRLG